MSIIVLKNDSLTVSISTFGAEIISVIDKNGTERIWQGKETVWSEHAPILFPICGALKDNCYYLDGKTYTLPKHGFAKNTEWNLWETNKSSATFMLDETNEGYPFQYKLLAKYTITGSRIEIEYKCINEGERTLWYCIGSHEGYVIEDELEDYILELETTEDVYLSRQVGNLLEPDEYLLAKNVCAVPLKTEYFVRGAMIMRSIKSRSVALAGKKGKIVRVDYPDMGVVIIWTKPGEKFLCIEPWTAAPDLITADNIFSHKPGSIELHAGESNSHRHIIFFC